ncbi:MAG: hypothetical protein AAGD22_01650 [Verrucomicrobiota bacterium]
MKRVLCLLLSTLFFGGSLRAQEVEVVVSEQINEPFSICFDEEGHLYGVEFTRGNRVFKVSRDGDLSFVAGVKSTTNPKSGDVGGVDGDDPVNAHFHGMHDLAMGSNGDLYLADTFNYRLRRITGATGELETVVGTGESGFSGDGGPGDEAKLSGVYSLSFNADESLLYLADLKNRRIRAFDPDEGTVRTVVGNGEKGRPTNGTRALDAPLPGPRAVALDGEENIYIVSREGHALRVVGRDGRLRTLVNESGKKGYGGDGGKDARKALMSGPKHACIDPEGNVLIADTENHAIRKFVPSEGRIYLVAGVPETKGSVIGGGPLETLLNRPHGVRVHDGWLYIADSSNDRVLRFRYGDNS